MKYLEDDQLAKLTSELTDVTCARGDSSRILNGRMEAFITKRAGNDHKYAHALGEAYVAEMELAETQLATAYEYYYNNNNHGNHNEQSLSQSLQSSMIRQQQQQLRKRNHRKRSQSAGGQLEALGATEAAEDDGTAEEQDDNAHRPNKLLKTTTTPLVESDGHSKQQQQRRRGRPRACSLDSTKDSTFDDSSSTAAAARSHTLLSQSSSTATALGDLNQMGTRRLMTDLILTLNASFPDYDFGTVRPRDFLRVPTVQQAMSAINDRLDVVLRSQKGEGFLPELWSSLDKVISLQDVQVYTYLSNDTSFLTQTLAGSSSFDHAAGSTAAPPIPFWTFNYFFVNKHMKRILLFCAVETMQSHGPDLEEELNEGGGGDDDEGVGMMMDVLHDGVDEQHADDLLSSSNVMTEAADDGDDYNCGGEESGLLLATNTSMETAAGDNYYEYNSEAISEANESNFDLDPAADVAGGIPVESK